MGDKKTRKLISGGSTEVELQNNFKMTCRRVSKKFLGQGHKKENQTPFLSHWDAGKEGFKGDSQQNGTLLGICTEETSTPLTGL